MVENVEQIEARLAAYIDGELTPDERVELERHLDANPTHRALLRELTGHRDLLRSLPREPAPEDLSEPLESAIERDALLGGGADPLTEFRTARARRWWPQLLAAAAIFILAFGLGAIVFFVLPPKHPTVAIVQPPEIEEAEAEGEGLDQVADASTPVSDQPPARDGNRQAPAEQLTNAFERALGGVEAIYQKSIESVERVAPATAQPAAGDTLVVTITADDVQQASNDLRRYFSTNGIAWSEVANPQAHVTLAKANEGVAEAGETVALSMQTGNMAIPPLARSEDETTSGESVAGSGAGSTREALALAEPSAPRPTVTAPPAPSRRASRSRANSVPEEPAAAPTIAPVVGEALEPRATDFGRAGGTAGNGAETSPGADRYVVLAALDRTQAERLATLFTRSDAARRAEVRREPGTIPGAYRAQLPAAQQPPTRSVQVGLSSRADVADELLREGEEFTLLRPTTRPADTSALWLFNDDRVLVESLEGPATRPSQPFSLQVSGIGRELDAQAFTCVVVLRTPEASAPAATQPATPTTRPAGTIGNP